MGTCVTTLTCLLSQIKLRLKSLLARRAGCPVNRTSLSGCRQCRSLYTAPPYESALESSLITALSKKIRFCKRKFCSYCNGSNLERPARHPVPEPRLQLSINSEVLYAWIACPLHRVKPTPTKKTQTSSQTSGLRTAAPAQHRFRGAACSESMSTALHL